MKFSYPEGATPIEDISSLKPSWVKTQSDLNQVEAENIFNATSKHLLKSVGSPQNWFNVSMLQKIHHDMFFDVWSWAGKFRTIQTIPGIEACQIIEALRSLCCDVEFWCTKDSELEIVEQAARIHHRLALIHPFPNGNGRFSRLISDRYLKAWKCPFPNWPTDLNRSGQCRKRYIESLKQADKGNYKPLILFTIEHGARDIRRK